VNSLRRKSHHSTPLQNACEKYGIENLKFELILALPPERLLVEEQRLIDDLNPAYNVAKIAGSPGLLWLGKTHKEETKLKMSESRKSVLSSKVVYTDEVRALMSARASARANSPEGKARLSAVNIGRKATKEVRAAMSERRKGEGSNTAILTNEIVFEIKTVLKSRRSAYGLMPALAKKYGVKTVTIGAIASGRSWKHIIVE
jgi:group I intron endonuclease